MTRSRAATGRAVAAALAVLLAGCGSATPETTGGSPTAVTSPGRSSPSVAPAPDGPEVSPSLAPSPAATDPGGATPSLDPAASALATRAWASATLTDVTTGQPFTIAGLAGKPVFIEAMAIWCTNCRQQQERFTQAFARLQPGLAEYVVLTVDPSETAEDLARYQARHGFTGRYAVAGRDLAAALEAEFGPNVLNPPSVPLVFVSATGEVSFSTGPEAVEEIIEKAGA